MPLHALCLRSLCNKGPAGDLLPRPPCHLRNEFRGHFEAILPRDLRIPVAGSRLGTWRGSPTRGWHLTLSSPPSSSPPPSSSSPSVCSPCSYGLLAPRKCGLFSPLYCFSLIIILIPILLMRLVPIQYHSFIYFLLTFLFLSCAWA